MRSAPCIPRLRRALVPAAVEPRRAASRRGAALIELLCALTILTIGLLAIGDGLLRAAAASRMASGAARLGHELARRAELLRALGCAAPSGATGWREASLRWTAATAAPPAPTASLRLDGTILGPRGPRTAALDLRQACDVR